MEKVKTKATPTKKLPPKMSMGAKAGGTPQKQFNNNNKGATLKRYNLTPVKNGGDIVGRGNTNDELMSSLLRMQSFDSISSIKDESLDIDLSACVTISNDSTALLNGNSVSSSDFWRMLDENAVTPVNLDASNSGEDSFISRGQENNWRVLHTFGNASNDSCSNSNSSVKTSPSALKPEQHTQTNFSGTFLRPEPPTSAQSPLKKVSVPSNLLSERRSKQIDRSKSKSSSPCVKPANNKHVPSNQVNANTMNIHAGGSCIDMPKPIKMIKLEPTERNSEQRPAKVEINGIMNAHAMSSSSDCYATVGCLKTEASTSELSSIEAENDADSVTTMKIEIGQTQLADAIDEKALEQDFYGDDTANVPPSEPLFKCQDCSGMILHGLVELAPHEAAAHKILHRCGNCSKDFENVLALKKHEKTHRAVDLRKDVWKKCPDCGKCLKLGSMWMHRKIHTDNKKYGCDICGQKFVQKINLTHHSRVHTSEKPFECPECQKRFQERSHLQRHQKYHAQTRSFRCDKCGKMYKTERCLKVHNLVHLEKRPFACTVCEKSFISNSKLKQHSNIHTGERPFKCNYCPRDFTNFPNWLKHTRRRHKVDHKTGEHLENIPSYCSKKSTKNKDTKNAAKASESIIAAAVAATASEQQKSTTTGVLPAGAGGGGATAALPSGAILVTVLPKKPAPKRKRKLPIMAATMEPAVLPETPQLTLPCNSTNLNGFLAPYNQGIRTDNKTIPNALQKASDVQAAAASASKTKRERKQATPKQVQKTPAQTAHKAVSKTQTLSSKTMTQTAANSNMVLSTGLNAFATTAEVCNRQQAQRRAPTDLHSLSITSAEDLIMEQALEMEESGLYDTPAVSAQDLNTDNAISADSETALRFHIKKELMDIEQEDYQHAASSLESSPYSSPASANVDALSMPAAANAIGRTANNQGQTLPTLYFPTYIDSGLLPNDQVLLNDLPVVSSGEAAQSLLLQQQMQQLPQYLQSTFNHVYIPISMSGNIIFPTSSSGATQQLQLPSVDTLLFTQNNTKFHSGKRATSLQKATAASNHL